MTKTEKINKYHNMTDHELADLFGERKLVADAATKECDEIKDELKRRLDGDGVIEAAKFTVTVATSYATRIDTKKLRDVLGDAVKEVEMTSESVRVTVKPTVIFGDAT